MTKMRPSGTATVPAKTACRFMGFRVLQVPVAVQSGGEVAAGSDCSTLDSVGLLDCPWVVELPPQPHNNSLQTNAAESDRGVRMTTPPEDRKWPQTGTEKGCACNVIAVRRRANGPPLPGKEGAFTKAERRSFHDESAPADDNDFHS